MKIAAKRCKKVSLLWLLIFAGGFTAFVFDNEARAVSHEEENFMGIDTSIQPISVQNYSGLAGLVSMVCADASELFYDFYSSSEVYVEPFVVLGEFKNKKVTLLGATLADQMTAVINNDTLGQFVAEGYGENDQRLHGVLQEIDGYLRIHISGLNSVGERRSFVVNVEMSEPIYRALHTHINN